MGDAVSEARDQRELDATGRTVADAPTRRVSRAPMRSGAITMASAASIRATKEALLAEEVGRIRVTARVLMLVVAIGTLLVPFLQGEERARQIMVFGLVLAAGSLVQLHRLASSVSRYDVHQVGLLSLALAAALGTAINFFGVFSPAPMIGSLGLYIFCLGSSTRYSVAMFAVIAGGQLVLGASILLGWRSDPGLITASSLDVAERAVVLLCVLLVYVIAFGAGRAARGKLVVAVEQLEAAVRQITERDVQLNEAKRELERAAWVGGEGRFTHQQLGSFRLGNIIGRGGMGEVYEAEHVDTGEDAAVKLLQRGAFAQPQAVARFAREACAAAALDSEHVVRVLEVPSPDSPVPYLAMERLRGEDLGSLLRREKRLSRRDTLQLVRQVGMALDAARRAGVIHRDLKPQNLFLARGEGAPVWKVLDFGVSKLRGQQSLTQDQLIGTPEYMPPEQARGDEELDHRADLYGLAAVAYRCLTGRPPFTGKDLATTVYRVVNLKPPAPSALSKLSDEVEAVLAIGLARDPRDRFDSGKELARAFEDALSGELSAELLARGRQRMRLEPWESS